MQELLEVERDKLRHGEVFLDGVEVIEITDSVLDDFPDSSPILDLATTLNPWQRIRQELGEIRQLLSDDH
jgi:hypothetical protein